MTDTPHRRFDDYNYQMDTENRLTRLETNYTQMETNYAQMVKATEKNTVALEKLTSLLSENKGALWMAFKFASVGTVVAGALFTVGSWWYNTFHQVTGK